MILFDALPRINKQFKMAKPLIEASLRFPVCRSNMAGCSTFRLYTDSALDLYWGVSRHSIQLHLFGDDEFQGHVSRDELHSLWIPSENPEGKKIWVRVHQWGYIDDL